MEKGRIYMKRYVKAEISIEFFSEIADVITVSIQAVGEDDDYIRTPSDNIW